MKNILERPAKVYFAVFIFAVDCEKKLRWEDGACISSCPSCLCGPMCPKAGNPDVDVTRKGNKTSREDKQESTNCLSGDIWSI